MNKLLLLLLAIFALAAGFFLGMGSRAGIVGALLPGLIAAVLIAGPCIRRRQWRSAWIIVIWTLVGCYAAVEVPDGSPVKRFCREQTNLIIRIGDSYQLGTDSQSK